MLAVVVLLSPRNGKRSFGEGQKGSAENARGSTALMKGGWTLFANARFGVTGRVFDGSTKLHRPEDSELAQNANIAPPKRLP